MENLQIFSIVLCISGLFGTAEGLTGRGNITVICTNESISENEIQLLCNLETFICSSMDVSQEKFTIDQSSIQLSGGKPLFRANGKGAQNSLLANYSCQGENWVNMSTVFSAVPDPDTTTMPVSHPSTIYRSKSSTKQKTNTDFQKNERRRNTKKAKPPKCKKNKKCPQNEDSSEERKGRREAECCNDDGNAEEEEDPDTTTVPVSHPSTIYRSKSSTKQPTTTDLQKDERRRNPNNPPECQKTKNCGTNEGSREDRNGRREAECCNDDGKAKGGDEKDLNERLKNGFARLYTAIATFSVIGVLIAFLLLLAAFYLRRWKKRIEQSTLKAGGASAQRLEEGDSEKKVVTVNAEATNSGNPVLPPVYNPTGHIYQEITDTPQNSSQEQQLRSQPTSNGQYSLLQLPV